MVAKKSAQAWEFGDFQTPRELAVESLQVLKEHLNFPPVQLLSQHAASAVSCLLR